MVKLFSVRETIALQKYHLKVSLKDYYMDISDYDMHVNQVILQGQFTLDKWIRSQNKKQYKLFKELQVSREPYFISIHDNVYLAQSCDDLKDARVVYSYWKLNKVNPRYIPSDFDYEKIDSVSSIAKIPKTGGVVSSHGSYTAILAITEDAEIEVA
jgi:hypothetical protein